MGWLRRGWKYINKNNMNLEEFQVRWVITHKIHIINMGKSLSFLWQHNIVEHKHTDHLPHGHQIFKGHLLFHNFVALGFWESLELEGLMGEKSYSQMEVIVPELCRMHQVGRAKKKITPVRIQIKHPHVGESRCEKTQIKPTGLLLPWDFNYSPLKVLRLNINL